MFKAIEQFFKSFGELFPDLKIRRYILVLISIALPLLVWFIESQTSLIFFWYLQRKLEILKDLSSLNDKLALENHQFSQAYLKILNELDSHSYFSITEFISNIFTHITFLSENLWESQAFWKVFWGAFIGVVFACISLLQVSLGNKSLLGAALGAGIFGILCGILGLFIPTIFYPIVNYVSYPILQISLLLYYSKTTMDTKNSSNERDGNKPDQVEIVDTN